MGQRATLGKLWQISRPSKAFIGNCKVGSPIFDSADLSEYFLVLKMA